MKPTTLRCPSSSSPISAKVAGKPSDDHAITRNIAAKTTAIDVFSEKQREARDRQRAEKHQRPPRPDAIRDGASGIRVDGVEEVLQCPEQPDERRPTRRECGGTPAGSETRAPRRTRRRTARRRGRSRAGILSFGSRTGGGERVGQDEKAASLRVADVRVAAGIHRDAVRPGGRRKRSQQGEPARFRHCDDCKRRALRPGKIEMREVRAVVDDVDAVACRDRTEAPSGCGVEVRPDAFGAADEQEAASLVQGNAARSLTPVGPLATTARDRSSSASVTPSQRWV